MTHSQNVYFGYPESSKSASEGLDTASDIVQLVNALLIGNNDLHQIQEREINGLSSLLSSVQNAMEKASVEIEQNKQDYEYGFQEGVQAERQSIFAALEDQGIEFKTDEEIKTEDRLETISHLISVALDENEEPETTDPQTKTTYPKKETILGTREKIIASTWRQGVSCTEISQAMSLKKAAVERVVARLQGDGALPQEPDLVQSA